MNFLKHITINTVLFITIAWFFKESGNFYISSVAAAFVASVVLAILNACIKPILTIISLPITFITLGFFSVIINALMLRLTSFFVGEAHFHFASFSTTMLVAFILSICNMVISSVF